MIVWVLARPQDAGLEGIVRTPKEVTLVKGASPEELKTAPQPDAILVCSLGRKMLEPVWPLAGGVRWVHSRFAGIETLLFPALAESPAIVTNGKGVFSDSLGEFAIAAMLHFAKDLARMRRSQAAKTWDPFDVLMLQGRTLGIVGYGDIGKAIAARARPFGMKIVGLRRRPEESKHDALVDEVLPFERRAELMARSDYVVVATPLTAATRGIVGPAEIAAMKPGGVLVNLGRGPCVDEAALVTALRDRKIYGAALDVFDTEPLPPDHPFWGLDNLLLSPHCADHVEGWLDGAMDLFLDNLERFRSGQPLLNVVDKQAGY